MPHPVNENDGMADILILSPQGAYDGKVPKVEEYINCYKEKSAGEIKFTYNKDAASAGT